MTEHKVDQDAGGESERGSERFKRLPEPIRLKDTIATQDTRVARDPEGGRDTDHDFFLRHAGG